jgi:hypothetical protein
MFGIVGKEQLPDDSGRVYRDTHRVVLKSPIHAEGEVGAVRIRLHDRPAGPGDGTGWQVCTYSSSRGEMGEGERFLIEQNRRDIIIDPCVLGQEQRIAVSPPIPVEAGQYVGLQNRSSETVSGFEYASTRGGMCLSLDDVSAHGQYIWKFEGGLERVSQKLDTSGKLKERHVGFCAELAVEPEPGDSTVSSALIHGTDQPNVVGVAGVPLSGASYRAPSDMSGESFAQQFAV